MEFMSVYEQMSSLLIPLVNLKFVIEKLLYCAASTFHFLLLILSAGVIGEKNTDSGKLLSQ